jgi:hypothetical protein
MYLNKAFGELAVSAAVLEVSRDSNSRNQASEVIFQAIFDTLTAQGTVAEMLAKGEKIVGIVMVTM